MSKIVAFHSNQLCLRGTEVALYTYAKYNEEILGNKSIIIAGPNGNLDALPKFKARFEVHLMHFGSVNSFCKTVGVDYLYIIKAGNNDGYVSDVIPTIVHAVFRVNEPHGYKYLYVSDWLARDQGYSADTHSLPHIIEELPAPTYDLRSRLNIPPDSTVFGCYGGSTEFNIGFVHEAIKRTISENKNVYFTFMNIAKFCADHNQVIHLPGTWSLDDKSAFVNSANAMIHARSGGETFGCAVGEFASANKPVVTFAGSGERSHIEILGERGIYYNNFEEVLGVFNSLSSHVKHTDYYASYLPYKPEPIMSKFKSLLL